MSFIVSGFLKWITLILLGVGVVCANSAYANEGGGPVGPTPMKFVVNLGNPALDGHMLAIEMVLEGAAEVAGAVNMYKPKVQHEIILLLSSEDANKLRTVEGKTSLGEKIKEVVNKVLKETEKTGVKEVLFTNFMIQ